MGPTVKRGQRGTKGVTISHGPLKKGELHSGLSHAMCGTTVSTCKRKKQKKTKNKKNRH